MPPRYRRVVLGGTFDHLHAGHEALLGAAFRSGRGVAIGLTSESFLADHPKPLARRLAPYSLRRRVLARWLSARYARRRWAIVPIQDRFGRSVEEGIDALIVSADTLDGGRAVNRERRRLGRRALPLIVVPLVLADDLEPVSSRRIRAGVIDRTGRRLAPIRVALRVSHPEDLASAKRAVQRAFGHARLEPARASRARRAPVDLEIVLRRTSGGWRSTLKGPHVSLRPVKIPGRAASDLVRGLGRQLRRSASQGISHPGRVPRRWRRTSA